MNPAGSAANNHGAMRDGSPSAAPADLAEQFPVGPDCPCRDIDDCAPCVAVGYCVVDADLYRLKEEI